MDTQNQEQEAKAMWCFTCDELQKNYMSAGAKCAKCGSLIEEVTLKPQLNKERLAFIGILTPITVLFYTSLETPFKELSGLFQFLTILGIYAMLTLLAYFFLGVFVIGIWKFFSITIPTEYPSGRHRGFSLARLGMEAIKSVIILIVGTIFWIVAIMTR